MSAKPPVTILHTEMVPLPQAVAAHLRSKNVSTWDHILVVLPTIEAGRRVVGALLEGIDVIFPPQFATPLTLVPFGEGEGVATTAQAGMAWHATLSEAKDCPLTFGGHSGTKLAASFVTLTRDLAAGACNIPGAAKILSARDPRWLEWCGLWKSYMARLASAGLSCPAEVQIGAAEHFLPPPGITNILVAGVADLPPLARMAIQNCEAEILIHAPGLDAGAFDEFGCAVPEFWSPATLPVRDSQIQVVSDPAELGRAVVEIESSSRIAVFSGDAGLSTDIACALEESGREGFMPEGNPLNRHPVTRLATLIARLPGDGSWGHLESLVFHPDFFQWIKALLPREAHKDWNRLGALTFCADLREIADRLGTSRSSGDERDRKRLLKTFSPLVEKLLDLRQSMSSPHAAPALRKILSDIYGPRDMGRRPGDKEAAKAVIALLDEISAFPGLAQMDAAALLTMLEAVPGTWTPAHESGAIEIEGWLELAGEDAQVIVLAGLNEGLLPSKRRVDALLPDAARAALGLDDAVSRHARDASILHAALAVRDPQSVRILSLRQAADGSPLKPSRLLLRVPDKDLPQRVRNLVTSSSAHVEAPLRKFSDEPFRVARPAGPILSLSATAFKSHLSCPLRFYLSNRLGFSEPGTGSPCLGADGFGSWIHDVLQQFGDDPVLSSSQNADEIRSWLLPRWDALFHGLDDDVTLMLQRESGRLRLEEFSTAQAAMRADGWRTKLVEWKFSITPPDWPLALRGRIDRVDVRDGAILLIDYKTGSLNKSNPARSAHLKRARPPGRFGVRPEYALLGTDVWCDLQLPLYAMAISQEKPIEIPKEIRLAYFLIADDVAQTGLCEWADADMESAARCARGVADEVASDAVLEWIAAKDFSRFAVDPDYDDFEPLALSHYIEGGALVV
ncbi:MAG: PD-(D/E)XK nuclease family protein [Verrucomicrobia bacterium]|nr:PD-(D/E)XK nuclease family protein [Verrucomicrobiota bacterium]